jgi:peptidoglycan/xylan/chitin deacetylase (PgdA/CDA1 family)
MSPAKSLTRTALSPALLARRFAALPGRRPAMRWPGGARLAVCIAPDLGSAEAARSSDGVASGSDLPPYGWRDYGHRVGLWRMAQALAEYPVAVTAAVDPALLEQQPEAAALVRERAWELMGHAPSMTPPGDACDESQERALLEHGAAIVRRHTGQTLAGLLDAGVANGPRLADRMVQAGLRYLAGAPCDDVPVPKKTAHGLLWCMPCQHEIGDAARFAGSLDVDLLVQVACEQFDRLWHEADEEGEGLVYCWPLHPHLIGQPHAVGALRRVLDHVCSHGEVWHAQARDIVDAASRCHEGHPAFEAWRRGEPA